MKKLCTRIMCAFLVSLFVIGAALPISALSPESIPYHTYEYNAVDQSVEAPAGYAVSSVIYAREFAVDPENMQLSDIYAASGGDIFLLDAGAGAVYILDKEYRCKKKISSFIGQDNDALNIVGAQGLTVHQDHIYIADTEHQRILRANLDGRVDLVLEKPDTPMLGSGVACHFTKVLVGSQDRLYAIASDVNMGALVFDKEGSFLTFFGSATVETTAEVILKYIRRQFMSEIQRQNDYQYTPVTLTNLDIDENGFIYTVEKPSQYSDIKGKVRALNAAGVDVFDSETFGDFEWDRQDVNSGTQFIDISVQDDGYLALLDDSRKRVFLYTPDCKLLGVFGASGEQKGNFVRPTAIESIGEDVLVADAAKNTVQIFKLTAYGACLKLAENAVNEGDYENALTLWKQALSFNTNCRAAHIGMGVCYDYMGDYEAALKCFKQGYANEEYSVTYRQWRKEFMKTHFIQLLAVAVFVIAGLVAVVLVLGRLLKPVEGSAYCRLETKRCLPIYTLFHPAAGFEQLRSRRFASYIQAMIIVLIWLAAVILRYFCTGFSFNENRAVDFQIFFSLIQTVGLYLIFILANFGLSSFMTGKGKLSEIMTVTSYALIPYILSIFINILLSNMLVKNEAVFLGIISGIGLLWSAGILFIGMMTVHQYSVSKTLLSFIVTIAGMLVIVFLIVLLITLFMQLFTFIESIVWEVSVRQ